MTLDAYLVIHCCSHCGKISIMELKKNSVVSSVQNGGESEGGKLNLSLALSVEVLA